MQRNNLIELQNYQPSHFLVNKIDLRFELDEKNTLVDSLIEVKKNPDAKEFKNELVLNGTNLQPDAIILDDKELSPPQYEVTSNTLVIKDVPNAFKLRIKTHLNPSTNKTLSGLYVTKNTLVTLCEPDGFSRLTYFLDRPDVQTSYTTTLIANEKQYPILLSNGTITETGKLPEGKHWVTWSDPIIKPSYLFVLVAGKFQIAEDKYITKSGREIGLQAYVQDGLGYQTVLALDNLKKSMRWDEDTFGLEYDLNSYKVVAVDDFGASADENTGVNIFKTDCLLGSKAEHPEHRLHWIETTVPHEYFHHWSGNRVTIRDWFQITLKEGLTTFRQQLFSEDTLSKTLRLESINTMRNRQFRNKFPARPQSFRTYEEYQHGATSTIYDKGAEIFRMFQTILGKEIFRKAMHVYFNRYKGQAATIENYVNTMEEISGKDLSQFILWFDQAGTPKVEVIDEYNEKDKTYTLTLTQSPSKNKDLNIGYKPLPIPIRLSLLDPDGQMIPLTTDDSKSAELEKVLLFNKTEAQFVFKNIESKPTPSLLRDFSAPVDLDYFYLPHHLITLMKYDSDIYNKTEAAEKYMLGYLSELIEKYSQDKPVSLSVEFIATLKHILEDQETDPRVLAKMLVLPTEIELAHLMMPVNVDAIKDVKAFVLAEIAKLLKPELLAFYHKCDTPSQFADDPLGRKQIPNLSAKFVCLSYLCQLKDPEMLALATKEFETHLNSNLSASISTLKLLVDLDGNTADAALEQFYKKHKGHAELIQEWFEIQASSRAAETPKRLLKLLGHEAFDIKDAELVDTLTYGFLENFCNVHSADKSGYKFYMELLSRIDNTKPSKAKEALLILDSWRLALPDRQTQFKEVYENLLERPLSRTLKKALRNCLKAQESDLSKASVSKLKLPGRVSKTGLFGHKPLTHDSNPRDCVTGLRFKL